MVQGRYGMGGVTSERMVAAWGGYENYRFEICLTLGIKSLFIIILTDLSLTVALKHKILFFIT
jgi:hypothetical protein